MDYQAPPKKKNRKPLYLLLAFLLVFIAFIYFITRPSLQSLAIKEIQTCYNTEDVKQCWYKYKADLSQDAEFLTEIRNKLASFNLPENEIQNCKGWLPPPPTSINLIIIPDLSRRITDTINNPNQISNDITILNTAWNSFVKFSKLRIDTKDKLSIEVTDIDQAKGQFGNVANQLIFDLSTHVGKSNRLYFTAEKDTQFLKAVSELYALAKPKPLGADYRFYLRRYLANNLKKSNLFVTYINKVIIVTDGYLEAENKEVDTKIYSHQNQLYSSVDNGNILEVITSNNLNIPKVDIDLTNTEIMVCEVNERKSGKGYDFEILKTYWEDWFKRMNAKKVVFIQREQATEISSQKVSEFILQQ